jgi:hypothetical protein
MTVDLLNTKDTGLVGAIGEAIAWQYLWEKGIHAYSFGTGRPWFRANKLGAEAQPNFDPSWLKKRQLDYLSDLLQHGPRRWDFVAIRSRELSRKRKTVYLVEVKVRRQGKSRHDLRGSLKGKIPEDLRKVKWFGFRPLLLIVDFLDNWKYEVIEREL